MSPWKDSSTKKNFKKKPRKQFLLTDLQTRDVYYEAISAFPRHSGDLELDHDNSRCEPNVDSLSGCQLLYKSLATVQEGDLDAVSPCGGIKVDGFCEHTQTRLPVDFNFLPPNCTSSRVVPWIIGVTFDQTVCCTEVLLCMVADINYTRW